MKLHYNPETISLYIELRSPPGTEVREVADGLNVDIDAARDQASKRLDLSTLETVALPFKTTRGA